MSKNIALRHARWYRQLGEAHYGLGHLAESRQNLERSLALLGCVVPESVRNIFASILFQAARQLIHRLGRRANPLAGLAPAEDHEYYLEATRSYALLGEISYFTAEAYLGLAVVLAGLNQSEKLPPTPEQAKNYANLAIAANLVAAHGLARAYMQRALDTVLKIEQLSALAHVLHLNGVYAIGTTNWQRAEDFLAQAVQSAERLSDKRLAINTQTTRAILAHYRSRYRSALGFNQAGYELALQTGNQVQQGWGLYSQAENYNRLGDFSLAIQRAEQAIPVLAGDTRPLARLRIYTALAIAQWRSGLALDAWQTLQEILDLALSKPPTAYSGMEAYTGIAEICLEMLAAGKDLPVPAETLWQKVGASVKLALRFARLYPAGKARSLIWLGLWQHLQGKGSLSRRTWQEAMQHARDAEMPYEEGLALYHLGWSLPVGDMQRSELLGKAAAIFEKLEARFDQSRAESD